MGVRRIGLPGRSMGPQDTPTHEGDVDSLSPSLISQDTLSSEVIPTPSTTKKELRYISMLNQVLPPTVRVVAWSPVAPTFSARSPANTSSALKTSISLGCKSLPRGCWANTTFGICASWTRPNRSRIFDGQSSKRPSTQRGCRTAQTWTVSECLT
jgi:hypothetical protein